MKHMHNNRWWLLILVSLGLGGCVGTQTFTTAARSGETVMLAVGWQKTLARQNLTITITPASGAPVTYLPGDARVRGVLNLYPDPGSNIVVDKMTGQATSARDIANLINNIVTQDSADATGIAHDNEWWQTTLMMDLPSVAAGLATIQIVDSKGATFLPITVEILPGTSTQNLFNIRPSYNPSSSLAFMSVYPEAIHAMERAPRSTVTFSGPTIPYSLQVGFAHTSGIGKTWVINPRGDIKNLAWNDDGSIITVVASPVRGITTTQWLDFKFYIAGGLSGLTLTSLKAYDINGNPITGVTAAVQ